MARTAIFASEAESLARRLPHLILAARRSANALMQGLHGRRQAGTGDQFWQFRPFQSGEPASRIDWRRSAKDQRLSVKEREWEAAHTVYLWADMSRSMDFSSAPAVFSKADCAAVMMLALAEILVDGGERIAIPGVLPPQAGRNIIDTVAARLAGAAAMLADEPLPATDPLPHRAEAVIFTDGLAPLPFIRERLQRLAAHGATGHVVLVNDPAEEVFPYVGHLRFRAADAGISVTAGRAESLKDGYLARLHAQRDGLRAICATLGWSLALHRTDRPAAPALMALYARMNESAHRPGGAA